MHPGGEVAGAGSGAQTSTGIGAMTLATSLGNGNVTIQTQAAGSLAGDIHVDAPVSWSSNRLTLQAHGDINVNTTLSGNGSAQLSLLCGQGAVATGNPARVSIAAGAGAGLTPIGSLGASFRGQFEGLGHTITNLRVNDAQRNDAARFGLTDNARISNLNQVDVAVTGRDGVGGLTGVARGAATGSC